MDQTNNLLYSKNSLSYCPSNNSENKEIWIFNHYAFPPYVPGGTRHFDLGKELVQRGHTVTIFASSFLHYINKDIKTYKNKRYIYENIDGVNFIWLKTLPYFKNDWKRVVNMFSYSLNAYMAARKIHISRPNVIIGSSVHLFAAFVAYRLAKLLGVPFIMEVRDLWPLTLIELGMSKWHPFIILLSVFEKFLYKHAHKIITLLPKAHDYIKLRGVPGNKIEWIPNGINLKNFSSIYEEYHKDDEKFTIMYAGAIGEANNLGTLLEVADKLSEDFPKINFSVIGDGPKKIALINEVQKRGLNNITFHSPVLKANIPSVLNKSDALFLSFKNIPLYKYGVSPNKLFDYLAAGKPIIFAINADYNPGLESDAAIIVSPDDPDEIAKAAITLYNMSADLRREMGLNGRKFVEKYHSIPILVDKLEAIIREVTNIT